MPLGDFTRARLEARAADQWNTALDAFANLAELAARTDAEFSAGTLDGPAFYQGDTTDKANILGALDVAKQVNDWLHGGGNVAAPGGDPIGYARFLIGLG